MNIPSFFNWLLMSLGNPGYAAPAIILSKGLNLSHPQLASPVSSIGLYLNLLRLNLASSVSSNILSTDTTFPFGPVNSHSIAV